jgi:hypothetical protein
MITRNLPYLLLISAMLIVLKVLVVLTHFDDVLPPGHSCASFSRAILDDQGDASWTLRADLVTSPAD